MLAYGKRFTTNVMMRNQPCAPHKVAPGCLKVCRVNVWQPWHTLLKVNLGCHNIAAKLRNGINFMGRKFNLFVFKKSANKLSS